MSTAEDSPTTSSSSSQETYQSILRAGSSSFKSLLSQKFSEKVSASAAAEALDKATAMLPSFQRRQSPTPPPVLIAIRPLHSDQDLYLPFSLSTTTTELLARCAEETGLSPTSLRIYIEEDRPISAPGFVSSLRASLGDISNNLSRERVRESLVEWVNFLFVPEALNKEIRNRGVVAWLHENIVVPYLLPQPPPHIAVITVCLQERVRRVRIELSATSTVARVREVVEKQSGLSVNRQRIVVIEQATMGPLQRMFWAVARVIYSFICMFMGIAISWVKWLAFGPNAGDEKIKLKIQGGDDQKNSLELRKDMTLGELETLLQLQLGDGAGLEGLVLASSSNKTNDENGTK